MALVDRTLLASDTLSTHAIARGGVVQLHRWGLLDEVGASSRGGRVAADELRAHGQAAGTMEVVGMGP